MKFTLSSLKRHLTTHATLNEIVATLTKIGFEVEEVSDKREIYQPFIVAKIMEAVAHPNADKLKVCQVDGGTSLKQIVCGASNARGGIKVVMAPIGATIPSNGMVIKAATIRDVSSNGMLCSADELLLRNDHIQDDGGGIIELPESAVVGSHYYDTAGLNDVTITISLTPNRGDAASVYGIARDLAATGIGSLITPASTTIIEYDNHFTLALNDKTKCQEFALIHITGVANNNPNQVPSYINNSLKMTGFNLKTPLVNISNFTMFEYGRPNHIYDAEKVVGSITIRNSHKDEKFTALGGLEYTLPQDLLVIADDVKVLAIAGVMGGELSKVDENTTNILIEVADFCPKAVAHAGRVLNIISESRYRFERRVDNVNTDFFANYISQLILENLGGETKHASIIKGKAIDYLKQIEFDHDLIKKVAGIDITWHDSSFILTKLGFTVEGNMVSIPSFRQGDISRSIDLVEEILRIYGLDNILSQAIDLDFSIIKQKSFDFAEAARSFLVNQGFDEMITYSFISPKLAESFGDTHQIELANPISNEMKIMRHSHLPMLLEHAEKNLGYGIPTAQYFEIGNVFQGLLPQDQKTSISALSIDQSRHNPPNKNELNSDFLDIKKYVFSLLKLYGLDPLKCIIIRQAPKYYHPGKSAALHLGKNLLCYFGALNPNVLDNIGQANGATSVMAFELFIDNFPALARKQSKSQPKISNFQSVVRDFAFEIASNVEVGTMLTAVSKLDILIEQVSLFDIYRGSNLTNSDNKSVGFSVTLRSHEASLKDSEIALVGQKIISLIQKNYGGVQR